MLDGDSPYVHNVSSSKQNVTSRTGIATLAVNGRTSYYWHAFQSLPPAAPSSPPSAEFHGTPTTGDAPLAVNFTDDSTGSPTGWSWDFGDGSTSTEQNPAHTYSSPGTYTVKLTARNAAGENTATKVDYITATQPPDFALSVAPQTQTIVRGARTTYDVAINPIGGFSGFVDLSVSGLPAGASAIFDPNPLQIFGPATSTLTILTTTATKQRNYPLVVTASSGLLQHTADVSLNVKRR
jgi:PKD repeat protein